MGIIAARPAEIERVLRIKVLTPVRFELGSGRLDQYAHPSGFSALVHIFEKCDDPWATGAGESQNTVVESTVTLNDSTLNFAVFEQPRQSPHVQPGSSHKFLVVRDCNRRSSAPQVLSR